MFRTGVFPGTFDPPTIAHLAIAETALKWAQLDRLDFAISVVALGKEERGDVERRVAALHHLIDSREDLGVEVTDAQLIADIAAGYDVVVMGADKWAQVNDPKWYSSEEERDAALARLPRVVVAPRTGHEAEGVELLDVDPAHRGVSSSRARNGEHHLIARRRLIVDAMNVIGSTPDGWWKDRDGALRRLVESLQERAASTGDRIAVVADGRPLRDLPEGVHGGVLVTYATRRGRNAADDRIVDEVARDKNPGSLTVITSDRELKRRVEAFGARVEGASAATDRA
jgi:nicotinic acid mononucleotide adenylyltransferase/predicted RNA-binding protein with PIN domain